MGKVTLIRGEMNTIHVIHTDDDGNMSYGENLMLRASVKETIPLSECKPVIHALGRYLYHELRNIAKEKEQFETFMPISPRWAEVGILRTEPTSVGRALILKLSRGSWVVVRYKERLWGHFVPEKETPLGRLRLPLDPMRLSGGGWKLLPDGLPEDVPSQLVKDFFGWVPAELPLRLTLKDQLKSIFGFGQVK